MSNTRFVEACCVADQFCIAGAELERPHQAKGICFACGQRVCSKCSSKRKYMDYGIVRLCNDCQVEYDGNDRLVMARLNKMAGH